MPASAGRVRMPHNNRMSTSGALKTSDIWSKTIGHDPYAAAGEQQHAGATAEDEAKARGLMELARHQNVAGRNANRDDFAKKMYLGLKPGKQRRDAPAMPQEDARMHQLLEEETSSSEDEFVEVEQSSEKETKMKKSRKRDRKRKKKRKRYSSSEDDSSSDESSRRERHRKRRDKKKRKKKYRRKEGHHSESESSDSDRHEHKKKKRSHHKRKRIKRDENHMIK